MTSRTTIFRANVCGSFRVLDNESATSVANARAMSLNGGRILVETLRAHAVDRIACVPGESYLAVLDALYDARDAIDVIVTRHEGAAANMADADAKLTGRPGICFVTRGPGATHASVGIHTAKQDSTPLLLFVGQVPREHLGREAFQEIDLERFFAPVAKWAKQVTDVRDLAAIVRHGFRIALSDRQGPVVIALPEDVLTDEGDPSDLAPLPVDAPAPHARDLERLAALLDRARRPLAIVGGTGWDDSSRAGLVAFAERQNLPVACAFRRQDLFDNRHPLYAGDLGLGNPPSLNARVREADLILAIGTRLGEVVTGAYTLLEPPRPHQTLVHVHPSASELGSVYRPDVAIHAAMIPFVRALAQIATGDIAARAGWSEAIREEHRAALARVPASGDVDLAAVVRHLDDVMPDDAIVTTGAGNYSGWVQRWFAFSPQRRQLAPTSGAMGYGVPAAIAAKRRYPQRTVVAFSGDGDFGMYPGELATAQQYGIAPVVIVVNNGVHGTIRMHQERTYPGRQIATALRNPDFAAMAQSFGAFGERVVRTADFPAAFERACNAGRAALLDLHVDPNVISVRGN